MDEHEKWHRIYEILFPDAGTPYPSPYLESKPSVSVPEPFMGFIQREMPSRISNAVETLLGHTTALDAFRRQAIQEIVLRTLNNLREEFGRLPEQSPVLPIQPEGSWTPPRNGPALDAASEIDHNLVFQDLSYMNPEMEQQREFACISGGFQDTEIQAPFVPEFLSGAAVLIDPTYFLPDSAYDSSNALDLRTRGGVPESGTRDGDQRAREEGSSLRTTRSSRHKELSNGIVEAVDAFPRAGKTGTKGVILDGSKNVAKTDVSTILGDISADESDETFWADMLRASPSNTIIRVDMCTSKYNPATKAYISTS
ncbi:hypothetical protein GGR53DRAFT_466913 [Hypoxylon sp. FL1150]|nr:hypothetical protein GGR53DRAFT_466913 [Hypoxylon sp. FL1150]